MATTTGFNAQTTAEAAATALSSQISGKTGVVTIQSAPKSPDPNLHDSSHYWCLPGGLGFEASRAITKAGVRLLIITGRSHSKLQLVQRQLLEAVPSANIRLLDLDLGSRESIRKAAKEVLAYKEPSIDVLINNASPLAGPFALIEGVESTFATAHLGHFLFTSLIFPKVLAATEPRIVNIASDAQHAQGIRFGDIEFKNGEEYNAFQAYGQAKAANSLFAVGLANRYAGKGLQAYSLHPGVILTQGATNNLTNQENRAMYTKMGVVDADGNIITGSSIKWKSLEEGAATHVVAAFDPKIKAHNGSFLVDGNVANEKAALHALDKSNANQLWDLSEQLLGQKFEA